MNSVRRHSQLVERAVAVANATPELKCHGTHVIGSNEEDSVLKSIQHDWAQRRTGGQQTEA